MSKLRAAILSIIITAPFAVTSQADPIHNLLAKKTFVFNGEEQWTREAIFVNIGSGRGKIGVRCTTAFRGMERLVFDNGGKSGEIEITARLTSTNTPRVLLRTYVYAGLGVAHTVRETASVPEMISTVAAFQMSPDLKKLILSQLQDAEMEKWTRESACGTGSLEINTFDFDVTSTASDGFSIKRTSKTGESRYYDFDVVRGGRAIIRKVCFDPLVTEIGDPKCISRRLERKP